MLAQAPVISDPKKTCRAGLRAQSTFDLSKYPLAPARAGQPRCPAGDLRSDGVTQSVPDLYMISPIFILLLIHYTARVFNHAARLAHGQASHLYQH